MTRAIVVIRSLLRALLLSAWRRLFGGSLPPTDPRRFCEAMDKWAALMAAKDPEHFETAWRTVRMAIGKSCLLDRMLYGGEQASEVPCPVHKGIWSGIHLGWPGDKWSDGSPVKEDPQLRAWWDAGCRCAKHVGCGCTTGWQPTPERVP